MSHLHYTIDGETPLCGWDKAHPDQEYMMAEKLTIDACERVGMDLCDMCLYVMWRTNSHLDILGSLPKCGQGLELWPNEEGFYTSCDIPLILHENIPAQEQIHWDFHFGYWVGDDPGSLVYI